jgi:16S rRNA (uracil1498-N3)-methyltransferase
MDFVIEKATELGVMAFQPFFCERSVGRTAGDAKLSRWKRLARTAAQQCRRTDVPEVHAPITFDALVKSFAQYDIVLFAWELAEPQSLTQRLAALLPPEGKALVVVGPEGGFTHAEADDAAEQCADLLWLGPRVLRTDTAALVLLAVIGAVTS